MIFTIVLISIFIFIGLIAFDGDYETKELNKDKELYENYLNR